MNHMWRSRETFQGWFTEAAKAYKVAALLKKGVVLFTSSINWKEVQYNTYRMIRNIEFPIVSLV